VSLKAFERYVKDISYFLGYLGWKTTKGSFGYT